MLYDRLGLDIERAAAEQTGGDRSAAAEHLRHAQTILAELRSSLDVTVWAGGADLASLYGFLLGELIAVHTVSDPTRLRAAGRIVAGLRASWQGAATQVASGPTPAQRPAAAPAATGSGTWVG
jgi:flagellar protein FliS